MELTDNEIVDILDIRDTAASTAGYTLLSGVYENSDLGEKRFDVKDLISQGRKR